jgi:hypothetical protein
VGMWRILKRWSDQKAAVPRCSVYSLSRSFCDRFTQADFLVINNRDFSMPVARAVPGTAPQIIEWAYDAGGENGGERE